MIIFLFETELILASIVISDVTVIVSPLAESVIAVFNNKGVFTEWSAAYTLTPDIHIKAEKIKNENNNFPDCLRLRLKSAMTNFCNNFFIFSPFYFFIIGSLEKPRSVSPFEQDFSGNSILKNKQNHKTNQKRHFHAMDCRVGILCIPPRNDC